MRQLVYCGPYPRYWFGTEHPSDEPVTMCAAGQGFRMMWDCPYCYRPWYRYGHEGD